MKTLTVTFHHTTNYGATLKAYESYYNMRSIIKEPSDSVLQSNVLWPPVLVLRNFSKG